MIEKSYKGTYLQVKTFTMLLDWHTVTGEREVSLDVEAQTVTCRFTSIEDAVEADYIWKDVVETMNTWVEMAIAAEFYGEQNKG